MKIFTFGILTLAIILLNNSDLYQKVRQRMVREQIVARGISDQNVIQAMNKVKRHLFVPKEYQRMAYEDLALSTW